MKICKLSSSFVHHLSGRCILLQSIWDITWADIQDLALCHRTQIKFPLRVWNLHFFGEHPPSPRLGLTSVKTRQLKVSPPSWPSCLPLPGLSSPVRADTGGMVQIFPCTSGPNVKQKCSCWSLMFESAVFQRLSDQKQFHSCFLMSNLPPRAFGAMPNLCNRLLCKREVPGRGWLNSYNATQLKPHDYINFWSLLAVLFGRLADFCSLHAVFCSVTLVIAACRPTKITSNVAGECRKGKRAESALAALCSCWII